MNPQIPQITQIDGKDPRTYAVIGAAIEVHKHLGCGFLEAVYQEALALEFSSRQIPYKREVELSVFYKGKRLEAKYRADFVCFDSIIVEVKAVDRVSGTEESQIINYLNAAVQEIGLLLNFGTKTLEHRRFIFSKSVQSA